MANIPSQVHRNARSLRERNENRRLTQAVKTHFRRLEEAIAGGNADAVATEHKALVSRIDKAVGSGAMHRNTAARKKSRAARISSGA